MNHNNPVDERLLKQVDDRLEYGKPSDHAIINTLADTLSHQGSEANLPDPAFMNDLEARLVAQLQQRHQQKEETTMFTITAKAPQRIPTYSLLTWAAAVIVIVLMGSYLVAQTQSALPSAVEPTAVPLYTMVVATQNIKAGAVITDDMLAVVSLSALDFDKLKNSQPQHTFLSDPKQVVGQLTNSAIFWLEPINPMKLGHIAVDCPRSDVQCIAVPEGLHVISLPLPVVALDSLGLVAGDRVDILADADNQLRLISEDVLITSVQTDKITFATSSWKLSVLIWLWQTKESYAVIRHQGEAPARDEQRINYGFISPEPLPDNYKFDLIAGLPDSQGYTLVGAPYALDAIQFTQRDHLMQFWFTDLDRVSVTDGTGVIINLPESDAALLNFLIQKGATLSFIPQ